MDGLPPDITESLDPRAQAAAQPAADSEPATEGAGTPLLLPLLSLSLGDWAGPGPCSELASEREARLGRGAALVGLHLPSSGPAQGQ